MKSFTDIEQSKKLAEILPLESADMGWYYSLNPNSARNQMWAGTKAENADIPCWSLAALLDVLPNEIITDNKFECHYQIHIGKYSGGNNITFYQIAYGNARGLSGSWHDMINTGEKENLIDCCVQMILILHELKML